MSQPGRQYLSAQEVLPKMHAESGFFLSRTPAQILVLAMTGGTFVTLGALFSILLSNGVSAAGPQILLQGLGFSVGFFMVILSRAALFTEANVLLPASALQRTPMGLPAVAIRFWVLAWLGNMLGAFVAGAVISFAQVYPESVTELLAITVGKKMAYLTDGGTALDWGRIVVSGMLGNGLIGMAAFFAIMANTLVGKYVPIFLVVSLFVAGNLQHSPANMGYFSLSMAHGGGPGWVDAFLWNVIPAGIGNILGGSLLVVLPFWFAFQHRMK
ncbi:formate/nitrite transporter family protein [Aliiruegeria lutimaris]|uniref:Formate transporter n=1 Tax=Aliiruegeria lutimaris TaxID=571298 RepID=A0A1G9MRD2_9RHOB|nr:formate/nitrite transporter family protein [Aliiruegeria lutimaris]SDL76673.1 formate transporter [Aliiruegeria lutimaris]